jgi:L-lactate utilization protein LutC
MARATARKPAAKAGAPKPRVVITAVDESPAYYANHLEMAHGPHEFEIVFARLPAKISEDKLAELNESGRLETEALARVIIPTSLMLEMINVFNIQKDKYEAKFGPLRKLKLAKAEASSGKAKK